jgi:Amt family ammonium transporter
MGWTGFNGGDPYVVSSDASLAVLNTHLCTATSLLTWVQLGLDIIFFRKASVIGSVQGMITSLVCITPAAGKSNIKKKNLQYQVLNLMYILAMQI